MSLDVYLELPEPTAALHLSGIFIRENGATKEITREEWDKRHPGRIPMMIPDEEEGRQVYWRNITHNLGEMAEAAGIYKALWRPEEIGISKAAQLIPLLSEGLRKLRADPDKYEAMNPDNGWGDYEGLCQFVADYLRACGANPTATVRVSR